MTKTNTTIIGILGSKLDGGFNQKRWKRWRPSVSICQQPDLPIDRYELLYEQNHEKLAHIVADDIAEVSPSTNVTLHSFEMSDPWDLEIVFSSLHQFANEFVFKPNQNRYLINITTGTHVQQICMFLLAESRHLPGELIQASPGPTNDDPIGSHRIIDLDLSKYDAIANRFSEETQEDLSFLKSGIDTKNKRFNAMMEQIEGVAIRSRSPILISGPTGAGKTQLARRIFELKQRRQQTEGSFVEVNCATLRGDQAMGALFGHTKGAYTGATTSREGLLRSADKGILFLDEIGELGLDEQAMLLRAIEEKTFLPVGSDKTAKSDFQLIAGTNRDLFEAVNERRFREDLLARINLWTFSLPSLRERKEDISPNLEYEIQRQEKLTGRKISFNSAAKKAFLQFAKSENAIWASNFRDLNAAVTRMATLANYGRINKEHVEHEIERLNFSWKASMKNECPTLDEFLSKEEQEKIDRFNQFQLHSVLEVCKSCSSLSQAGRKLFAVSRESKKQPNDADRLRKYLAKFKIQWSDIKAD